MSAITIFAPEVHLSLYLSFFLSLSLPVCLEIDHCQQGATDTAQDHTNNLLPLMQLPLLLLLTLSFRMLVNDGFVNERLA